MSVATVALYIGIGLGAGVLAGFFGVGGGLVVVPGLVFLVGLSQQTANGTSLVALLAPVGILGVLEYYNAGKISRANIECGLVISLGMFFGAYFGARWASGLSDDMLRKCFAIFMVLVAARMWFMGPK